MNSVKIAKFSIIIMTVFIVIGLAAVIYGISDIIHNKNKPAQNQFIEKISD